MLRFFFFDGGAGGFSLPRFPQSFFRVKIIPPEQYPQRDQKTLLDFLGSCQASAREQGRAVLASITLRVSHIDPLAVLQSIHEERELHFYLENPQADEALAGAEAVLSATFSGEDRFARAQSFIDASLADAVAIGDMDAPFSGPHFFCAFTFEAGTQQASPARAVNLANAANSTAPACGAAAAAPAPASASGLVPDFAAATVFVPRWQVARHAEGYTAVANILVGAQTNVRLEAARVLAAHAKFSRFDYSAPSQGTAPASAAEAPTQCSDNDSATAASVDPASFSSPVGTASATAAVGSAAAGVVRQAWSEVGGQGFYVRAVARALERIGQGHYEKIVLARMLDLRSEQPFNPLGTLNRLRESYPSCYAFSVGNGRGQSFIGSSPERLLRVEGGRVFTEALAGSIARAGSAGEDARLGSELLHSDKDLREHALVREAIVANLRSLGVRVDALPAGPRLRRLANLQHLWTPISGTLPCGGTLLQVASLLHPTPAVGGVPRLAACADVGELEAAPRGLFSGVIGWVDARGGGEMIVGLRSGLVCGNRARLYAGAGIVEGSDPQQEYEETGLKLRPLLSSL